MKDWNQSWTHFLKTETSVAGIMVEFGILLETGSLFSSLPNGGFIVDLMAVWMSVLGEELWIWGSGICVMLGKGVGL